MRRAQLSGADLTDAKLTRADLREVRGLSCDQLAQAQDWEGAYRDAELACDAAIPDPDEGVIIEVPTVQMSLTVHPPTVTATGEIDEALPVTAAKTVPVGTAEEIDEATRQRFNETPATVVAEARRARIGGPNYLISTDGVPVGDVREAHDLSRQSLEQLRETLQKFHGSDDPDTTGLRNTQEVPLSSDDLKQLGAAVDALIALHRAPVITSRHKEAFKKLHDVLDEMKGLLDKLKETFGSLELLAVKVGATVLAVAKLIDMLG